MVISVALRKESVDRNLKINDGWIKQISSLSARRAWIEISTAGLCMNASCWSLSARRAWIEIRR